MKIREIPPQIRDKIAAGEVINSPQSVVKELIENSIDAGADEITVRIFKGGKQLIQVSDNGYGMSKDDLKSCAKRYTTSKLHDESDLENINTLGFRGEALASMAAVSELIVRTNGYEAVFNAEGNAEDIRASNVQKGTVIEIHNLFGRFPARFKFMKSDDAEFQKILALITRYSLVSENISFRLYKDDKIMFNSPKTSMLNKIFHSFGSDIANNIIPIQHSTETISVKGYVSKPGFSRKTRNTQVLFINGRLVKNDYVSSSIQNAYTDKLFLDRKPVFFIHLSIDPKQIDVNIHPSKEEVMLTNEKDVGDCIQNAVRNGLLNSDSVLSVDTDAKMTKSTHAYKQDKGVQLDFSSITVKRPSPVHSAYHQAQKPQKISMEVLGQVNKTYIIGYDNAGVVLVDQHAAQERILYEKYVEQLSNNAVSINKLVKPYIFSVSAEYDDMLSRHLGELRRYGFDVERFGRHEYAVASVPAVFGRPSNPKIILDIVDEINVNARNEKDRLNSAIATKACRAAVKGGDTLSIAQMRDILHDLNKCRNPYTCPHGRPTIIRMSWGDLEKKFKRVD